MASNLDVQDLKDRLVIKVVRKRVLVEAILSAVLALAGVTWAGWHFLPWQWLSLAATLVALADVLYIMRSKTAVLSVTNLEFISRAFIEGWHSSTRCVPRANIKWLEYQEDTTGPETAHHPGGLYAVLPQGSVCLLPHVDEKQTGMVIERILAKFPAFRDQWKENSPFGQHFTVLDLSRSPETP